MANFIQKATKRPGALTAIAKKAGAFKDGRISAAWLRAKAKAKGRLGQQARLALTLRGFRK